MDAALEKTYRLSVLSNFVSVWGAKCINCFWGVAGYPRRGGGGRVGRLLHAGALWRQVGDLPLQSFLGCEERNRANAIPESHAVYTEF
jgi:hypothetical protein